MKIQTKFFGEQEIKKEEIIRFDSGMPGFPNEKEFYLFPMEDTPFLVMQSIQSVGVAFVIMEPFQVFPDYEFDLPDEVSAGLGTEKKSDLAIFVILTVQDPFEKSTANLQAPIIFNQRKKKAKQYIINRSTYTTKHPMIQPPVKMEEEVK